MRIYQLILFMTLLTGCAGQPKQDTASSASWAYDKMITWNGNVYVAASEQVDNIGQKIGTIKHYSNQEIDSKQNDFSNYFKVGTNLYAIPNIETKIAIAVEVDRNHYLKAVNEKSFNKENGNTQK